MSRNNGIFEYLTVYENKILIYLMFFVKFDVQNSIKIATF